MNFCHQDFLSSHPIARKLMYWKRSEKLKLEFMKPLLDDFSKFEKCIFQIQPVRFSKKQFRIRLVNLITSRVYFDRKFVTTAEELSKFFGFFPSCFSNDLEFYNVYFSTNFLKYDKAHSK